MSVAAASVACARPGLTLAEEIVEIEPTREHRKAAAGIARPFVSRSIPIKFDAVLVGIAQVQRLADAVVAGAIEVNACAAHAVQRVGKRGACRIEDRGVE
jgi:hypothetical protein